jgi:hypothetical protein
MFSAFDLRAARGLTPLKVGIARFAYNVKSEGESYLFVTSFERVVYEATQ